MADMSLVLAALASAAAQAEGHRCGAFTATPDGLVSCLCGQFAFEVGRPVVLVPAPVAGIGGAA